MSLKEYKRIVIKVGTSTLTHPGGGLNLARIERLVRASCDLKNSGREVVIVTSGAVGVGVDKLGLPAKPTALPDKQAAAAVGQCTLMHIYDKFFSEYGHKVAQLLLTRDVMEESGTRENVANTFARLFEYGVVPIVNENDTVSVKELEHVTSFGDNDTLSAVVSTVCGADLLIILSDIEGLYDADPRSNPDAKLIRTVTEITSGMRAAAGGAGTAGGTGGMHTKLVAADIAMGAGIDMFIASGEDPAIISSILDGTAIGTFFGKL